MGGNAEGLCDQSGCKRGQNHFSEPKTQKTITGLDRIATKAAQKKLRRCCRASAGHTQETCQCSTSTKGQYPMPRAVADISHELQVCLVASPTRADQRHCALGSVHTGDLDLFQLILCFQKAKKEHRGGSSLEECHWRKPLRSTFESRVLGGSSD